MTAAAVILHYAKRADVVLERRGERLGWHSQTIPDSVFLALCKTNKAALLNALPDAAAQAPPAVDLAAFHERAAIVEYDSGLPHGEADKVAAREMGFDTAEALYLAAIEAWRLEIAAAPQTGIPALTSLLP